MRTRGLSHVGVTVSDFRTAVRFYDDVFGCPLILVSQLPADRVRALFGIDGAAPSCIVGWIRLPGGGVLELFAFEPREPKANLRWNSPGFTHIAIHVSNLDRWHAHLVAHGVRCLSKPIKAPGGHSLFYATDPDGNLIELIDLGYRYYVLTWFGGVLAKLGGRRRFREYYDPPEHT